MRPKEEEAMSANERTPLIAVVHVAPAQERYPHRTLRRICTVVLSIVPVIVIAALIIVLAFPPSWLPWTDDGSRPSEHKSFAAYLPWAKPAGLSPSWPRTEGVTYDELVALLLNGPEPEKAREWSEYYTSGPHLAGKNLSQVVWTRDKWQSFGITHADIVTYDIYVNYPVGHSLTLLEKKSKSASESNDEARTREAEGDGVETQRKSTWKVKFEASLEEDVLAEDPTSGLDDRIPTFHGYSASGNVTAPYVYVNYGTYWDFEELVKANVTLEGKIGLARYGHIFRGLKVKRAEELGMVGMVMYTDPGDDGEVTEQNGYATYPEGPAREPSSVQRGSVQYLSFAPGDPTTPGVPSKPGVPRQSVNGSIPQIPSIPISYEDALPLLKALNGYGPKASSFSKAWKGTGLEYKGVEYNIGPTPDELVLNLVNEQEYVITPMWNVIGIINGTTSDEVVVLGNHRDAWIAGGAGDPNSGSAAFNEVIRSFGMATQLGWKPWRTIVFASWDGEEYGLIGSTEWVEEYLPWLDKATVAYLNVDVGASGPHFKASAAPLLNKALIQATQLVPLPNQTDQASNKTVYDSWNKHISTMGSGSDFTAFQDFAGIPCIDMGFSFGQDSAVYHYHSNYDSFAWMDRIGDPGFLHHAAIAKVWAVLAAALIETPVIQFNATDYATALGQYIEDARDKAADAVGFLSNEELQPTTSPLFRPMMRSVDRLLNATAALDGRAAELAEEVANGDVPWWKWWERLRLYYAVRAVNAKYKYLERQFLHKPGLDGRSWFKHVVFAPGRWVGYAGATFPGLVEAIDDGDKAGMYRWAGIITGLINKAAGSLEG
ncbi:N-acetylated-alpha-linked acidic dipeptidase-like protein [Lineolata rhizophorae]|uniref:N-acetylated-alpha-linked acidic dipeptidase-like protein n=1 Tax=Lineolata rhizophorae TaxID=578093 RepID=A0A6A6NTD4_9PEZI|nr:N-acetylated-alpha-linked acidic dipeptidase-like protein [Lineolata rhizophorae]